MPRPHKPSWHKVNQCFRFTYHGKPVYLPRSIGRHDRPQMEKVPRAAWDWMNAWIAEREKGRIDPTNPTVAAVCELYLAHAEAEVRAGRATAGNYRGHSAHLSRFSDHVPRGGSKPLGSLHARDLDASDLEEFAAACGAAGLSRHYVTNLCKSVHAAFNWASERVKGRTPERYLPANPVHGYRPPKPPKESQKYLERESFRAFVRWAWRRARSRPGLQRRFDRLFVLLLRFIAETGCRPGEACALTWDHVKWEEGVALLTEWKSAKSTGRAREIHLTMPVLRLLRRVRGAGIHPRYVFTHALGKGQRAGAAPSEGAPWNSVALSQKVRKWRAAAVAEGLPVAAEGAGKLVAYILRHTYISDGLMHGMSASEVAELAGTSGQMIDQVYGHVRREHSAKRAAELARGRRGKSGGG